MPDLASSFESLLSLEFHVGATIALLAYGAYSWLGDEFIARQAEIDREMRADVFGLPDFEAERQGRLEMREKQEKTARQTGKAAVAAGAVLAAALVIRLML